MKGVVVLNHQQFAKFRNDGTFNEFFVNDRQIPTYAMSGATRTVGAAKEWKLFPQDLALEDFLYLYQRCDIAANAVDIPCRDTWGKSITVKVTSESGMEVKDSPLAKAIWQLNRENSVRAKFEEANRYAKIFGMGLIIMGLADDMDLRDEPESAQALSYLSVFSRKEISDVTFEKNPKSDRYGDIIRYQIEIKNVPKFWVHADRCIHVMEKTIEKQWGGISIFEAPYDLFQVLKNTDWSAGEAYYQNASPLFVMSWEGDEVPSGEELDDVKDDLEDLHVKKRIIKPKSWELDTVRGSGTLPDPGDIWNPIVERIAGAVKVPKQLLLGTSAGALASGEVNLEQYYKDIAGNRTLFAEPLLLEFYGKLQKYGVLPEGEFDLEWGSLWEMNAADKASILATNISASIAAMGDPIRGIPQIMSVEEVREQILGLNPEIGGGRQLTLRTDGFMSNVAQRPTGLGVVSLTVEQNLIPITNGLLNQTITLEAALSMFEEYITQYRKTISDNALSYLKRTMPSAVRDQVTRLPPEYENNLEQEIKRLKEYGEKLFREAAERGRRAEPRT